MLVLSRHKNETIVIGDGPDRVTICVTKVSGGRVYIGIDAPRDVPVHRGEVYEKIQEQRIPVTQGVTSAN